MGKGSSSGGSGSPQMPAEQKALFGAALPLYQKLIDAGLSGQAPYQLPGMVSSYQRPSMQGVMTGTPMYDIPDVNKMMPSNQWYGNISGDVMKGIRAPWEDASNQLNEQLWSRGQAGSAKGGMSGAAAAGQGELWSKAGQQMGLQAWQMTGPQMMQNWQAELGRNQQGYQNVLQERGVDYQNNMQRLAEDYAAQQAYRGEQLQGVQSPYSLAPGFIGSMGNLPQYATPKSNPWGSALTGGALGLMGGSMMAPAGATGLAALGGPWGLGLAGAGALLGGLSGK